jgi:anti-sigma factor RsiW
MPNCRSIDPLVTPYVDGEIGAADRQLVDDHVGHCPPCRSRVDAERAVRELCRERKASLGQASAPDVLRVRCARLTGRRLSGPVLSRWRASLAPIALAAAIVLVVGAALLYQVTGASNRVMAAELTADHVKCFAMNAVLGTHQAAEIVESSMASGFGWNVHLPEDAEREGMELIGSRPCLYAEGRVAHIMYRHNGQPVSLFMLPKTTRGDDLLEVFGHEAAIWSSGDHTFVLIAREAPADVERLVGFVRGSLR